MGENASFDTKVNRSLDKGKLDFKNVFDAIEEISKGGDPAKFVLEHTNFKKGPEFDNQPTVEREIVEDDFER